MPIYEFRCPSCGHRFELLCPMGERGAGQPCPNCGHAGVNRVMSTFARAGRADAAGGDGAGEGGGSSGCSGCSTRRCSTCH